jgi:hypothetical protein
MYMGKLQHYLSLVLFAAALMLGVQIPNFIDQYVKRVDAHYQEAKINFQLYQQIADIYHQGSVEELIVKHHQSDDTTFRAEAEVIEKSYQRLNFLASESAALRGHQLQKLQHILLHGDRTLLLETQLNYSANVPLNFTAGSFGLAAGVLISLIYELVCWLLALLLRRKVKRISSSNC